MWREAKRSKREENEKFEISFSNFARRRRNWILFLILRFQLSKREGEGNFFVWSSDLERESEKKSLFSRSDREVWNAVLQFLWRERKIIQQALHFRNKKEKWKLFSQVWKGETDFESFSSRFPEGVHSPIGCICLSAFSCPGSSIPTPRKDNRQEPVDNYQEPVDNRHEPPPL